jgi:hypothetical protein
MATKKPAVPADEKFEKQEFDLFPALQALDRKDYGYYGRLTEEQQRKFVPYMMTLWMSSIENSPKDQVMGQAYTTNEFANKHLFNEHIQHHPELQWMMLCAASLGQGVKKHKWIPQLSAGIASLKKRATAKDYKDYFTKVYPTASTKEVSEIAEAYTLNQQHLYRLSQLYPSMKREDLESLASMVTPADIDQYERDSGQHM